MLARKRLSALLRRLRELGLELAEHAELGVVGVGHGSCRTRSGPCQKKVSPPSTCSMSSVFTPRPCSTAYSSSPKSSPTGPDHAHVGEEARGQREVHGGAAEHALALPEGGLDRVEGDGSDYHEAHEAGTILIRLPDAQDLVVAATGVAAAVAVRRRHPERAVGRDHHRADAAVAGAQHRARPSDLGAVQADAEERSRPAAPPRRGCARGSRRRWATPGRCARPPSGSRSARRRCRAPRPAASRSCARRGSGSPRRSCPGRTRRPQAAGAVEGEALHVAVAEREDARAAERVVRRAPTRRGSAAGSSR